MDSDQPLRLLNDGDGVQAARPKPPQQLPACARAHPPRPRLARLRAMTDRNCAAMRSLDNSADQPRSRVLCEEFLYDIKGGLRPPPTCGRRFAPSSAGTGRRVMAMA